MITFFCGHLLFCRKWPLAFEVTGGCSALTATGLLLLARVISC